ncbi:hypothetical protein KDW_30700 [Dictyobacter vulcani]|uniref:Transmembrane protein n=1 Tax=Dictyobacter vulcani TaxID=2607529 RepID=A0A5J4KGU8_9CHLR|nr:hypothetical protein [Dictyobacter vulcani]GER88908.1 hypothetical protein KDW_30700 [Dictyobacter vulcani]
MQLTYDLGRFFRNIYITVMFIPLWIGSALFRVPGVAAPQWLQDHWVLFSILVFLQGALMLWYFVELLIKEQRKGKQTRTLAISCFVLAGTLFVIGLGAILKSNGIAWGEGLLFAGTIASPLFVIWILSVYSHERKHDDQQTQPAPMQPEQL